MKKVIRTLVLIPALTIGIGFASTTGSSPLFAERPGTCQVFCVTSQCSRDSQCTAAPNGSCNLACPKVGCCVYN
jgi:hypothetical protein